MKEECNSCSQMKKENTQLRKSLMENNKGYVDVCNENLVLKKDLESLRILADRLFPPK